MGFLKNRSSSVVTRSRLHLLSCLRATMRRGGARRPASDTSGGRQRGERQERRDGDVTRRASGQEGSAARWSAPSTRFTSSSHDLPTSHIPHPTSHFFWDTNDSKVSFRSVITAVITPDVLRPSSSYQQDFKGALLLGPSAGSTSAAASGTDPGHHSRSSPVRRYWSSPRWRSVSAAGEVKQAER